MVLRFAGIAVGGLAISGCFFDLDPPPAASSGATDAYSAAVLFDTPLGYWRLGERQGSMTANDEGNGHHNGTYSGEPTLDVPGAIAGNSAVTFDGKNDNVTIDDAANVFSFSEMTSFSIEAWFNTTAISNTPSICGKHAKDDGYALYLVADGRLIFDRKDGVQVNSDTAATPLEKMPPKNQWTYAVGTFDGSTLILWMNGDDVYEFPDAKNQLVDSGSAFEIGSKSGGSYDQFDGSIDEVAVYDHVLTPNRIKAHLTAAMR